MDCRALAGIVVTGLFVIGSLSLASAEEPSGFQDLLWGTPIEDARTYCWTCVRSNPSEYCRDCIRVPGPHGVRLIGYRGRAITLGRFQLDVLLYFVDNRFDSYHISTEHDGYQDLRSVTIQKLGEPTKVDKETYQNAFGAVFVGEKLSWEWPSGSTARLIERCETIDRSCLGVYSAAAEEEIAQRAQAKKTMKAPF